MKFKFRRLDGIILTVLISMSIGGILPASVQGFTNSEIVLFEGWNLISLPFTPEDSSIEVVLADISDNVESVWSYFRAGGAIDEIKNIAESDVCIIDIAFDTSSWDEYMPTTIVCIQELFKMETKIILFSTYIEGPIAYEHLMGEIEPYSRYEADYGVDYVYLGYIAGGEAAVAALANDIKSVFSSDYYGTPINYIPIMVGINSANDIQLVLSTGPDDYYYYYIRQWQVPYGTPVSRIVDSKWKSYSSGAPSDLAEMVEDRGYWIKMKANDILVIHEYAADLSLIDISFSRTEDTSSILQYWIDRANETIRLMVMCITQDELAEALVEAHNRGIDIDIYIDNLYVSSSGSDFSYLQDAGIDIRSDDRSAYMHHKVMIIDDHIVVTGSYNWSASAEDRNDENTIILDSISIAEIYMEEFNRLWTQG